MSSPGGQDSGPHTAHAGSSGRGLRGKLMAAVRPAFRGDELVFDPRDPVFGGPPCLVGGCTRPARARGMCFSHRHRWVREGEPDLAEFAATAGFRSHGQAAPPCCRAAGCGYGADRCGLCARHAQAWEHAGRPEPASWAAGAAPTGEPAACRVPACQLWAEPTTGLCRAHGREWQDQGRPGLDAFARSCDTGDPVPGHERIRLHHLGAQLKLEVQYVLQCRHEERRAKAPPAVVNRVVRFLAEAGVASLLDHTEQAWRERARPLLDDAPSHAFLAYAYRVVADLAEAGGWEAEYRRDVWQLRRLGFAGNRALRFDAIPQPWLNDLVPHCTSWECSGVRVAGWRSGRGGGSIVAGGSDGFRAGGGVGVVAAA